MKLSKLLVPTLKEVPVEAKVKSHQLMLKAGLIRKLASGIYTWLPLGLKILRKIEDIVRQKMKEVGAQEILMSGVQPGKLWRQSGRWDDYGKELLRFKDRNGYDFCLAPTHEEVITYLISQEIRSYRDLPLNLYQIQTKFRDEIRPRFGVMRAREFIMKDAYSFDRNEISSNETYRLMQIVYKNILKEIGLDFLIVKADSGSIGGALSHEFVVKAFVGESDIVNCVSCEYSSSLEKVDCVSFFENESLDCIERKLVFTPQKSTVKDLCEFFKVYSKSIAKTLIYLADDRPVAVMVRGDREVNEIKLKKLTNSSKLKLAPVSVIQEIAEDSLNFSGPIGLDIPIYADHELYAEKSLIVGANKKDFHYVEVSMKRDVSQAKRVDIRMAVLGDKCPLCEGKLDFFKGIEVGHSFQLGTKYSKVLNATYLDKDGVAKLIHMGCYGIGITRLVAAVIEQNYDDDGIIFPKSISPFLVSIVPLKFTGKIKSVVCELYEKMKNKGIEVLLDDRDLRMGIKFKDLDLLGIPLRIVVSERSLKEKKVELKVRATGEVKLIDLESIISVVSFYK